MASCCALYDVQEAINCGRKDMADPGRDSHKGVVHITNQTSTQNITRRRLADAAETPAVAPCHVVIVVDASGSMRTADVDGYESRTEAVYDCLVKDFVQPQLKAGGPAMQVGQG